MWKLVAGVLILGSGVSIGYGIGSHEPPCPTEDSCKVDYVNPDGPGPKGSWNIEPQVP
jgi:hypothetical protein